MFTELNSDEHNNFQAFDCTNANFKKVEKAIRKQQDLNMTFAMQIDNMNELVEYQNRKKTFMFNLRHLADVSKKLAEIAVFPALLSIIYYCFK